MENPKGCSQREDGMGSENKFSPVEKPVSLAPLTPKQAMRGLLAVKPKPEEMLKHKKARKTMHTDATPNQS